MKAAENSLLHAGFRFEALRPFHAAIVPSDYAILITYANRIPPHIGFCQNGIYYAFNGQGSEGPQHLGRVLRWIEIKKIPSLLVMLKEPLFRPSQDHAENFLLTAPPLHLGGSCLFPVRGLIEEYWNIHVKQPLIHGLMKQLEIENIIRETLFLNLEPALAGDNSFSIPAYDEQTVRSFLKSVVAAY
jgi:hypothetical protein